MQFAVERWADFFRDAREVFLIHFDELALHKDQVPLGMDDALYQQLEDLGRLHVLVARKEKRVIGYYIAIVIPNHPHNKEAGPVATCDMFYILPHERKGGAGAKLLMMAEKTLRERGVKKVSMSVKLKQNHQKLLEALGWEATDLVFQRLI